MEPSSFSALKTPKGGGHQGLFQGRLLVSIGVGVSNTYLFVYLFIYIFAVVAIQPRVALPLSYILTPFYLLLRQALAKLLVGFALQHPPASASPTPSR